MSIFKAFLQMTFKMLLKFEKFVLEVDNVWVQEKMLVISIFSLPDNAFTAPLGAVKSKDCVVKS